MNQNQLKVKFGKVGADTPAEKAAKKGTSKSANPKPKAKRRRSAKNKNTSAVDTKPANTLKMPEGLTKEEKEQWEAENEWQSDPQAQKDDF